MLGSHDRADTFLETPARVLIGPPVETPDEIAGRRIGTYQVESRIGAGGMGEVYLARDTNLNRPVALKLLATRLSLDEDRLRRFRQEAHSVSALNHPNILVIHDFGDYDGRPFMVTEFVEGQTLRHRMQSAAMPVQEAVAIGLQVANALAAAHARGIVHRDVKPENVMVRPDGYVKVLDFGLAKLADAESPADGNSWLRTTPGVVMGTPQYMSPEQARGLELDARSDVWSFGAMLYEMVAGSPPFGGATSADLLAAILNAEPVPLELKAPLAPLALARLVAKALRKSRLERHLSGAELVADLYAINNHLDFHLPAAAAAAAAEPETAAGSDAGSTPRSRLAKPVGGRSAARPPSIAVLPFVNRSSDPENEYFSDGLSEELINALAKIEGLQVASRTSAFAFKGKSDDIRRIGERLNVQTVLEGSVRKAANRLRIAVELVNTENGYTLWSEIYDREMADVFAVQDEIVLAIVTRLKVELVDSPTAKDAHAGKSLEAYHQFLKGRYYWNKRTSEAMLHAIEYYERAIAIDDAYGEAYAGLGAAYATSGHFEHGVHRPREAMPRANDAALRAQRLDPTLVEAVNVLAFERLFYEWDWRAAEEGFKQAIKIDDRVATVYHWYAMLLVALERADEGIATVEHAVALGPLSFPTLWGAAWVYHYAGRFERAIEHCRKVIEMEPYYLKARLQLGQSLSALGRHDEAIRELERAAAMAGRDPRSLMPLGYAYGAAGERDSATAILGELDEQARRSYVFPNYFASVYAGLNERDEAFKWLERAVDDRDGRLVMLKVDPMFAGLRDDPRYADLLRKVGLRSS